jgi:hypothetical protein
MCELLDEYTALGVTEVIVRFGDDVSMRSLDLFAREVIPEFRGARDTVRPGVLSP